MSLNTLTTIQAGKDAHLNIGCDVIDSKNASFDNMISEASATLHNYVFNSSFTFPGGGGSTTPGVEQFVDGIFVNPGSAGCIIVCPSAAALAAFLPDPLIPTSFSVYCYCTNLPALGSILLTLGAGCTAANYTGGAGASATYKFYGNSSGFVVYRG
jgi:hypothetical protein